MSLSKSTGHNPNYLAKVVRLGDPIKHPNADRMQGWMIDGGIVYTDMSRKTGDICIYFPIECVINDRLLSAMNLYSSSAQNADNNIKGYFPKQGRVRAVKLRGEPSQGFLLPIWEIESILGEVKPIIDTEFDTWNDNLLVWKYIVQVANPKEKTGASDKKKVKRYSILVDGQFRLHEDTQNLRKNIQKLKPEDQITLSYKLHGTSWVVGNVLTKRKRTWWEKLTKWLGKEVAEPRKYDIVYSSRTVVKNQYETKDHQHYFGYDLWADIKNNLTDKIPAGFTLYGEAVGYTRTGSMIQKGYDYGYKVPDRPIDVEVAREMLGVNLNPYQEGVHYGIFIYRITSTNIQGDAIELSTDQIADFCEKYQIKQVPVIWQGTAREFTPHILDSEHWHQSLLEMLELSKFSYQNVECYMCKNKVPAEGIVLRRENLYSFEAYKLKSFKFLEKETKDLDEGVVDMESEQTIANV